MEGCLDAGLFRWRVFRWRVVYMEGCLVFRWRVV